MWVLKKNYLVQLLNYFLLDLARPRNLLWFWNFGFILGISIVIQVLRGFYFLYIIMILLIMLFILLII